MPNNPPTKTGKHSSGLSYRDAGVDIDAGNQLVENIKSHVARTTRPEVIGGLGGFGGLFELPLDRYRNPVLVSGTDGVGTKLRLAIDSKRYRGVGIDLVGMCVNDILVSGAEPLFFLDYYATGKLDTEVAAEVVAGIADGCEQSGCALIGGETAEMPGMYEQGDFDLAGFSVGIVERDKIIDGSRVTRDDVIIGLGASGPHSNGYSLIRKVLEVSGEDINSAFDGGTLADALLAPTRLYVKPVQRLMADHPINAMAHITGGGLPENLPRVLPEGVAADIDADSWQRPAIFNWLQQQGNISDQEMYRTFNCGIGFVLVVNAQSADAVIEHMTTEGIPASVIGHMVPHEASSPRVRISN